MTGAAPESIGSFRRRARQWLLSSAPPRGEAFPHGDGRHWEAARQFQRVQYEAGFSGISWPRAYGGQGLTFEHQRAFNEEAGGYFLPSGLFQITLSILGMTLLEARRGGWADRSPPRGSAATSSRLDLTLFRAGTAI